MKSIPQLMQRLLQPQSKVGTTALPRLQQAAGRIVARLLSEDVPLPLEEASVHRARRSRIWIASFTGPAGRQVWRSTGLSDYEPAMLQARNWEARAREERARRGRTPAAARLRVGGAERATGLLTQQEVARILGMSERGVREVERRAFAKLRGHPLLRQLWQQYQAGELEETMSSPFAVEEIQALFDVAVSAEELHLVEKIADRLGGPTGYSPERDPVTAPVALGND